MLENQLSGFYALTSGEALAFSACVVVDAYILVYEAADAGLIVSIEAVYAPPGGDNYRV